jgi:hypothetical protein
MHNEVQLYLSEAPKFSWKNGKKSSGIMVAPEGVTGRAVMPASTSAVDLVGTNTADTQDIILPVGSEWRFRDVDPQVKSKNGGEFIFIVPAV